MRVVAEEMLTTRPPFPRRGSGPLNDEKRRLDVDLEGALKGVWRHRLDRGGVEDAGVVDQDVEGLVVEHCIELSKERLDLSPTPLTSNSVRIGKAFPPRPSMDSTASRASASRVP
jgi:hypothetical protein